MNQVVKSVSYDQTEILNGIIQLHCPDGFEVDVTYGNGKFYDSIPEPEYCFDITPLKDHVIPANSGNLPLPDAAINSLIYDPPFLTYVSKGRNHKDGNVVMTKRFGGYYTYDELASDYKRTIIEAYRVLKKKGIFVIKCQDIIHNHKMYPTHVNVINWADGFRLKDLFVLAAKNRMPGPQKGTQKHARVYHSYFLVFEKGGI